MDLRKYYQDFMKSKRGAGRAENTLINYQYMIEPFLDWCDALGYMGVDFYDPALIDEYLIYQRAQEKSERTIRNYYTSLRALYRWAERRGLLDKEQVNPFDLMTAPKPPEKLPRRIQYNEMLRLVATIQGDKWHDHRDRIAIQMLFFTGMRAGEFAALTLADVDFEERRIQVYRQKTKIAGFVPFPTFMTEPLQEWIEQQRPDLVEAWLWPAQPRNGHVRALTADSLKQMLERRCQRAGMRSYGPHAFRHGLAVRIVERGGSLLLVQKMLGHKDIRSTTVYT